MSHSLLACRVSFTFFLHISEGWNNVYRSHSLYSGAQIKPPLLVMLNQGPPAAPCPGSPLAVFPSLQFLPQSGRPCVSGRSLNCWRDAGPHFWKEQVLFSARLSRLTLLELWVCVTRPDFNIDHWFVHLKFRNSVAVYSQHHCWLRPVYKWKFFFVVCTF